MNSFCPQCGAPAGSEDRFCRACGVSLNDGSSAQPHDAPPVPAGAWQSAPRPAPPAQTPPPAPPRKGVPLPAGRAGRAALVGVLIAVVTGACLAAFIGLDDDDSSEQNATTNAASEVSETEAATQLDSDDDGIPDASDDEPYENPDDEEAPDETPEEQGPKQTFRPVGGSANDDDVRFKLESMQEVTTVPVGEYYEPIVPSRKAKLVSAVLTVKNNGQTKIDPFCGGASGVVLLDENDRNYEAEDNVIEIAGNDWVCGDGVSPGFKGTATLVFELPKKSDIGGLVVWNSEAENDYSGDTDQIVFTP